MGILSKSAIWILSKLYDKDFGSKISNASYDQILGIIGQNAHGLLFMLIMLLVFFALTHVFIWVILRRINIFNARISRKGLIIFVFLWIILMMGFLFFIGDGSWTLLYQYQKPIKTSQVIFNDQFSAVVYFNQILSMVSKPNPVRTFIRISGITPRLNKFLDNGERLAYFISKFGDQKLISSMAMKKLLDILDMHQVLIVDYMSGMDQLFTNLMNLPTFNDTIWVNTIIAICLSLIQSFGLIIYWIKRHDSNSKSKLAGLIIFVISTLLELCLLISPENNLNIWTIIVLLGSMISPLIFFKHFSQDRPSRLSLLTFSITLQIISLITIIYLYMGVRSSAICRNSSINENVPFKGMNGLEFFMESCNLNHDLLRSMKKALGNKNYIPNQFVSFNSDRITISLNDNSYHLDPENLSYKALFVDILKNEKYTIPSKEEIIMKTKKINEILTDYKELNEFERFIRKASVDPSQRLIMKKSLNDMQTGIKDAITDCQIMSNKLANNNDPKILLEETVIKDRLRNEIMNRVDNELRSVTSCKPLSEKIADTIEFYCSAKSPIPSLWIDFLLIDIIGIILLGLMYRMNNVAHGTRNKKEDEDSIDAMLREDREMEQDIDKELENV